MPKSLFKNSTFQQSLRGQQQESSRRSQNTLCRGSASSRAPFVPALSARGVSQVVFQAGSGSSRALQSQVAHSLVFPRSLTQGSFQWIISDHRLHALFFPALEVSGVQDVGTVHVDDVEAVGAARNFRKCLDCLLILDASSSAVRLVIAPAPAPFFTARIGRVAFVTPRFTRISLPSAAWNMTLLRVLVCRTGSHDKRREFNSCSRSSI